VCGESTARDASTFDDRVVLVADAFAAATTNATLHLVAFPPRSSSRVHS